MTSIAPHSNSESHWPARILVTGGRGFVGAAVVRHLVAKGFRVHVLGPDSATALPSGASETIGTVEDEACLAQAFKVIEPDAVLHFAAFSAGPVGLTRSGESDPERMLSVNVLGFRRLLEACVANRVGKVIWTSSTVVLGAAQPGSRRLDESAPRHPLVHYGLSKVLAEDTAQFYRDRYELATTGLRIPLMLGPGLWYQGAAAQVRELVRQALGGQLSALTVPDVAFDALHVTDVGPLIERLLACAKAPAPIYHVAGFTTDYREIGAQLSDMVPGFVPLMYPERPAIVYPLVSQARVEHDTGWLHRHDLRSTLLDMLDEQRSLQR
jgi:UDP-glucose 4-epimerase